MEHILSLSYGKDRLACLGAIEELGWTLDSIVHSEVWTTDTIPADLPLMVEFKKKADTIIKERWGIEVEHVRSKYSYQDRFYKICEGKKRAVPRKNNRIPWNYKKMVQQRTKSKPNEQAQKRLHFLFRNCG